MIFNALKWTAIIKLAMTIKPYARTALITIVAFWLVNLLHQDSVNFLKDTDQSGAIVYVYVTKWILLLSIVSVSFYSFKKIRGRINTQTEKTEIDKSAKHKTKEIPHKHQELLTKDKLMSKGDKILKR